MLAEKGRIRRKRIRGIFQKKGGESIFCFVCIRCGIAGRSIAHYIALVRKKLSLESCLSYSPCSEPLKGIGRNLSFKTTINGISAITFG